MDLAQMREAFREKSEAVQAIAQKSNPTDADLRRARELYDSGMDLQAQIKRSEESMGLMSKLKSLGEHPESHGMPTSKGAPSLEFSPQGLQQLFAKTQNRESFSLKAAIDTSDAPQSQIPHYVSTAFPFLREMTRVLDLIPTVPTDRPTIDFYKLTTGATAAATVAEGGLKPTSQPVYTGYSSPVRKIAHVGAMTDEVVADFPQFLQVIGEEFVAGLVLEESRQLLVGDGTGTNLTGLANTTGILTRAKGADTQIDAIAKGATDLRTGASYIEPDCIIMNPANFETVRLAKTTTGEYYAGGPFAAQAQNIFGIKTVLTTQMTIGVALVANLASAAMVYLREAPRLETSRGGADEFNANVSLIRCEERLALTVPRPSSIVKVTGL